MELSKFLNGDKQAIINREEYSYTISYYLKERLVNKEIVSSYQKAEDLAEDFILSEESKDGPTFLSEDA
jgi:hypothetical protein